MKDAIAILKAINNPVRLDIMAWLKTPEQHFDLSEQQVDANMHGVCVSIIQKKAGLSQSTISSYLSILQRADLLISKRIGAWTYYRRNSRVIEQFFKNLEALI